MAAIFSIAKKDGLQVIEDAAHALPSSYDSKLIGTLDSDATVFSFYANKTMTTVEGGMLVTRYDEVATRDKIMRLHGISRDAFDRFSATKPSRYYEIVAPGYKYNMTDVSAAIGICQLEKVNIFQKRRQEIAEKYTEEFAGLPALLPVHARDSELHSWHLYVLRLDENGSVTRDEFIEKMFKLGIGCSVHYIPLHLHPYWRDTYNLKPEMFPVSQRAFEQSVSLPIYSMMCEESVDRVISSVKAILLS